MTIEEMQEKHRKEIERLSIELEIAKTLPREARSIYWHAGKRAYGKLSYEAQTFKDACEILDQFKPFIIEAEHWKAACLSVMPEEINSYATNERATMDGASYCELRMHSYGDRRYQDQELIAWTKIENRVLEVSIKFHAPAKWIPTYIAIRDRSGRIIEHQIIPFGLGEDQFRRWYSEKPDYHFSYYWADVHNWESWKGCELQKGTQ